MQNQIQLNDLLFNNLQFEAQNARVTQSLSKDGANSTLFSLYLAMQINDPALHNACHFNNLGDDDLYASINNELEGLESAPKAKLYSTEHEYVLQNKLYANYVRSNQPHVYLKFLNALLPQSLHYADHETVFTDEIMANLPFELQNIKPSNTPLSNANEFEQGVNDSDFTSFNSVSTDTHNANQQSKLDMLIESIEQAKHAVL